MVMMNFQKFFIRIDFQIHCRKCLSDALHGTGYWKDNAFRVKMEMKVYFVKNNSLSEDNSGLYL